MKLDEIAAAIEEDYEVDFELVTVGELTPSAKVDLDSFQETIANFEHPTCSITLVDEPLIAARLAEAEAKDLPVLEHTIRLEAGRYLDLANFKSVVAAVLLTECLKLPGIKDGTIFRKNVRQSLGKQLAFFRGADIAPLVRKDTTAKLIPMPHPLAMSRAQDCHSPLQRAEARRMPAPPRSSLEECPRR